MNDVKNFILDKAKERFHRFGYKKTTMDELSRDCGMSKKTLYWHFYNKEDLLTKLMLREIFEVRQILLNGTAEASDPLAKLIQLIKDAIAIFSEDSFLTRLFKADEILFSPFISQKYDSVIRAEINSIVSAIICEGKKQGKFRKVDEKVVAYAGGRLLQAFSYMRTMDFPQGIVEQGYYTDVLVDFIINGIAENK